MAPECMGKSENEDGRRAGAPKHSDKRLSLSGEILIIKDFRLSTGRGDPTNV